MPKPGSTDPAACALDDVAALVSAPITNGLVTRAAPKDSALGWKAAAVHPLQQVATEYQDIVNDAARGVTPFAARRQQESREMERFYLFDGSAARLLGVAKGEPYQGRSFPFDEQALREAERQLLVAKARATRNEPAANVGIALDEARVLADRVLAGFYRLPGSRGWNVAPVDEAATNLTGLDREIAALRAAGNPVDPARFRQIHDRIAKAVKRLAGAVEGVAAVQMFYSIEPFFLFRLLVRYKIHSHIALDSERIAAVSKALTTKVVNGHDWLTLWLHDTVVDLGVRVCNADPTGNTLFFLKGGRAIEYAIGTPQQGTGDWDTQIVINPELPAKDWYAAFRAVSNAALLALKEYKLQFYMLMYHHAADFLRDFRPLPAPDPNAAPAVLYANTANTKAELIDVGVPRYDTVEAREQWRMLKGNILRLAGDPMPVPGYMYFVAEYLTLIREAMADASASASKFPSRVDRLFRLFSCQPVQALAQQRYQALTTPLPASTAAIGALFGLVPIEVGVSLIFQLDQFAEAYALQADPGLRGAFDAMFSTNVTTAASHFTPAGAAPGTVLYSLDLRQALEARIGEPPPDGIAAGCASLANSVAFGKWISEQMEAHLDARGAAMATNPLLATFFRSLATDTIFRQQDELELQLYATGGYAAGLYADYLQFSRAATLDQVTCLSLAIACALPGTTVPAVGELLAPAINACLQLVPGSFQMLTDGVPSNVIRFEWTQAMTFPSTRPGTITLGAYQPLAIEIVIHADPPRRPLLAYAWGLPVPSLRDLIIDYQERAAHVEEFAMRTRLTATIAALGEMLMQAANIAPPDFTVEALTRGDCHHLAISSVENVQGPAADYPPLYLPARAYELVLSDPGTPFADAFAFAPGPDRTLDVLVVNQGAGGIGRFAGWSAAQLDDAVVKPMLAAGVRARYLVLDFAASASLLAVFGPLLVPNGLAIATLYPAQEPIVTTATWTALDAPLQSRDLIRIEAILEARLRHMAAANTGFVYYPWVQGWSEPETTLYLDANILDRDAVSITRYLPPIGDAVRIADGAQAYAMLAAIKASPNLGQGERLVLDSLPASQAGYDAAAAERIAAALRARCTTILTAPEYGIGLDVTGIRLFGGSPDLWSMIGANRTFLLAAARGLMRCPAPFAIFTAEGKTLRLDQALVLQPIDPAVALRLNRIGPAVAQETSLIVWGLSAQRTVEILQPLPNYLQ